jgi:hypothetical protein
MQEPANPRLFKSGNFTHSRIINRSRRAGLISKPSTAAEAALDAIN